MRDPDDGGDDDDVGDDDVAKNNDDNLGQGEAVMATREWFGELVSKETTNYQSKST